MEKFLSLSLSGLATGAIYSILASGLVLTYITSGIFNFAHGAVAFATAYLYYQLNTGLGVPIVPALIISVFLFAPLLGLLLDRILLRRLAQAPVYARIVGTIGLLVALPNLIQWLVVAVGNDALGLGPQGQRRPQQRPPRPGVGPTPPHQYRLIKGVVLDTNQIAVFAVAAIAGDRALDRDPPQPSRARDARGGRPRAARGAARRERGADVRAGVGDDDGARRPRRRAHRAAVPTPGHARSRSSCSARWPPSCSAVCGRSRSRSPAGCCSASCRTSFAGYSDDFLPKLVEPAQRPPVGRAVHARDPLPPGVRAGSIAPCGLGVRRETASRPSRGPPGVAPAAAVGDLHRRAGRLLVGLVPSPGWLPGRHLRPDGDRAEPGHGHHLPLVRRRHRHGRHGEPRPGDVRHRGRVRWRVGAQP